MNERIKELVTATDAWCDQNFPPDWTERVDEFLPLWNEKFAELIVTDVTDILSTYRGKIILEDGFEYNCQHPIVAIRKHFGFSQPNMEQVELRKAYADWSTAFATADKAWKDAYKADKERDAAAKRVSSLNAAIRARGSK